MSCVSRRVRFLASILGVALACGASRGATFSMKAVKINNTTLAAPQSTIDAVSGDRIVAEVFLRGWNANEPGGKLTTFQFAIDGKNSFFKSEVDDLNVALPGCFDLGTVVKCASGADCPAGTPACSENMVCVRNCAGDADCDASLPVCQGFGAFCSGVNHDPSACTFADINRSDWVFEANSIPACAFKGVDVQCGATTLGGGVVDTGQTAYVGTVTIDLTSDACGTIIPALTPDAALTFIIFESGFDFLPAAENLTINVTDRPSCGGCSKLVGSVPDDCTVDAREPHDLRSAIPKFWFTDGFDFELQFNNEPEGGFMQSDFSITTFPVQPVLPSIDGFSVDGTLKNVTVSVNRPPSLAPPRWLCINFDDPNPGCPDRHACWARLPGDVNGDNTAGSDDLAALIAGLNSGLLPITRCDMDRSGACRAPDLVMWIDMAQGAEAFSPGLNKSLDPCPTLP